MVVAVFRKDATARIYTGLAGSRQQAEHKRAALLLSAKRDLTSTANVTTGGMPNTMVLLVLCVGVGCWCCVCVLGLLCCVVLR